MSRTLVISDFHIGSRSRSCVLELQAPLERLLIEVMRCDRLVLLGDIVELLEGRALAALSAAAPILSAIGQAAGPERQIVLVPGNHDRPLIRPWLRRVSGRLAVEASVPPDASPALARLLSHLRPAPVEVRYPGTWLTPQIYATHGHYLDRHLIPVSSWGRLRGLRGHIPDEQGRPADYERPGRVHVSPLMRWLPSPVADAVEGLGSMVRAATMPAIQEGVLDPRIAPVTSHLLSLQMRRHALPAMARVIHRLGIEADWVLFGHVHRLGPLTHDDPERWRSSEGSPEFVNTGSWLYEPRLVNRASPPHPYWPGGAVVLEDGQPPRATGLLDSLAPEQLHRPGRRLH